MSESPAPPGTASSALWQSLLFFESLDRVNRAIQGAGTLDQMMSDVLDALLGIFSCDRAWLVYPCDPDAPAYRVSMERTRPEYPGGYALGVDFPIDTDVAEVMRILRRSSGPVAFGPGCGHEVPQKVAEGFSVRTFIAMALYPHGDRPYIFGLHQCSHPRIWTPEDRRLFHEIGMRVSEALTGLLARHALTSLIGTIDGIVWEADAQTFQFTFVSPQAVRILGYPTDQWLAEPTFWRDHLHPADRDQAVDLCVGATRDKRDHDLCYRMIAADGREVWLHDLVTVVVENGRPVKLHGIMVDITKSKQAEQSQALFRALLDHSQDSIEVIDPETARFLDVNEAACRVHGYSREEYLALRLPEIEVEFEHVRSPELWRGHVDSLKRGGSGLANGRHRRKDGSTFPVEVSSACIRLDRDYLVAIVRDITERRQAEEEHRRLEEQFRQSQKLEAVGQLAGGIAHDFNNLLTVIEMQTSSLLDDPELDPEVASGLRPVMEAAGRAANLTRQLLTFSRQRVKQARLLDLGEVVAGTTKLLRRVLGEQVALETQTAPNLPSVHADPGMMEQLLMNLVLNARDAMPDGGRLAIGLDAAEIDEAHASAHPPARPGRHVRLQVRDTGCGIPAENLPRIFEPFFTTKDVGKGTGLGLATVLGITQQHNGWIEVESEVGQGSVFRVHFPAVQKVSGPDPVQRAAAIRGGTETILLVEDETAVRSVAAAALRRWGYRILEAPTAAEALRRWEEEQGRIDLLLTDVIMPGGTSGKKLAANLAARRSSLKIIYSSGYSNESSSKEPDLVPGGSFLPKPYAIEALLTAVRTRLDGP